ncbi:MAG: hypothetical protein IPH16_00725 [Haliscomenobacter sp.]|nr:hypothetical protein [Haliscomenobacter sp.]MBK7476833.1 hypothetical protein [Haliscomenobacter sp.]MBK8878694.1 hypothetical protein [Haliscomenobacter sp.]
MNLSEQLERIELKLRQLALDMRQIKRQNEELSHQNHQLQLEIALRDQTIARLQEGLSEAQSQLLLQEQADADKARQLKVQVDQYLREIDKCIEWLTNN